MRSKIYIPYTLGAHRFKKWIEDEGRVYRYYSKMLNISPVAISRIIHARSLPTINQAFAIEDLTLGYVSARHWTVEYQKEVYGDV